MKIQSKGKKKLYMYANGKAIQPIGMQYANDHNPGLFQFPPVSMKFTILTARVTELTLIRPSKPDPIPSKKYPIPNPT